MSSEDLQGSMTREEPKRITRALQERYRDALIPPNATYMNLPISQKIMLKDFYNNINRHLGLDYRLEISGNDFRVAKVRVVPLERLDQRPPQPSPQAPHHTSQVTPLVRPQLCPQVPQATHPVLPQAIPQPCSHLSSPLSPQTPQASHPVLSLADPPAIPQAYPHSSPQVRSQKQQANHSILPRASQPVSLVIRANMGTSEKTNEEGGQGGHQACHSTTHAMEAIASNMTSTALHTEVEQASNQTNVRMEEMANKRISANLRGCSSFSACKRKKPCHMMDSLPDHLVFEILLRLPAEVIQDSVMYVCRRWYAMKSSRDFIFAHLEHSTRGCLICCPWILTGFVAMRQDRTLAIYTRDTYSGSLILGCCNGLLLIFNIPKIQLSIVNPIIRKKLSLPGLSDATSLLHVGLAYVASTMEYKVVLSFIAYGSRELGHVRVMSLGVDKGWRCMHTSHLSYTCKKSFENTPLVTGIFMHWVSHTHILTLNVETETIQEIPILDDGGSGERLKAYLAMGSNLSFVVACNETSTLTSWDVWELIPETAEWQKLMTIDLEAQKHTVDQILSSNAQAPAPTLVPAGWLKPREVLAFDVLRTEKIFICYDVLLNAVFPLRVESLNLKHLFFEYADTLVWPDGC